MTGQRIRLIRCTDEFTKLAPGDLGTIVYGPDSLGTLHVKWDCGSSLDLIPGEDEWEVLYNQDVNLVE
jgi:hypothetical protein